MEPELGDRAFSCYEFAWPIRTYIDELLHKLDNANNEILTLEVEKQHLKDDVEHIAKERDDALEMVVCENVTLQAVLYKYKINRNMLRTAENEYNETPNHLREAVAKALWNNDTFEEERIDYDGFAYTRQQFIDYYGGNDEWEFAPRALPRTLREAEIHHILHHDD